MQEAYKTFDSEGKGFINIEDLGRVIESYNEKLEPAELEQLFNETDIDGDGRIDFKDFIKMMMAERD